MHIEFHFDEVYHNPLYTYLLCYTHFENILHSAIIFMVSIGKIKS